MADAVAANRPPEFRRMTPLQLHQLLAFMQDRIGGIGVTAAAQRLAERWQCPVDELGPRILALLGNNLPSF
jgi:hypothetical protein